MLIRESCVAAVRGQAETGTEMGRRAIRGPKLSDRVGNFWTRVTQGMQVDELWKQFRTDARTSYRLYSQEVDSTRDAGTPHGRHFLDVTKQVFWAFLEKLSPARRVLLLLA